MYQLTSGQGGRLGINICRNKKLVEDVEILLPVKFPWILLSQNFREIENFAVTFRHTTEHDVKKNLQNVTWRHIYVKTVTAYFNAIACSFYKLEVNLDIS